MKLLCCAEPLTHVRPFATPWTVARQAPLSMGFPREEYWSGLPFPFAGDLPNPGMVLSSLMSLALAGGFVTTSATWEALGVVSGRCHTKEGEKGRQPSEGPPAFSKHYLWGPSLLIPTNSHCLITEDAPSLLPYRHRLY